MKLGILKTHDGQMVPIVPKVAQKLINKGVTILLECDAGAAANFVDNAYPEEVFCSSREEIISTADVIISKDYTTDFDWQKANGKTWINSLWN